MRVLLAGASHEVLALAESLGHEISACVDPHVKGQWQGVPVFQKDTQAIATGRFEGVVMAIDAPALRQKVQNTYHNAGVSIVALEGGSGSQNIQYGLGFVAQEETVIGPGCRLGDGVRLNIGACLMAGAFADDFATFAPRATALEGTCIGARSYIGANAVLLPGTIIGKDCMVGAGAVVSGRVSDNATVKGNPAS